jgi:uncharacterized membrane protein YebE (DUF533 family)
MVVMGRAPGVEGAAGLSVSKCSNCSAPLSASDADSCEYCGTPVALDRNDWFLINVARPEAVVVPKVADAPPDDLPGWAMPDLANPVERKALLTRMAAIMAADGVVEPRERKLLKATAKRWQIPYAHVQPILEGRQPAPDLAPVDDAQKGVFLLGLVMAALVDGRVDTRERKMIRGVASSMHMAPDMADSMIAAQTRRLKGG